MISRKTALEQIVKRVNNNIALVSPLGRTSRDLFILTKEIHSQCFFCLGSMGAVVPFSLGLAIARPNIHVWGIEGDGSILMNLGALVTVKRYAARNLKIFILDNLQYESTGGQQSQPQNFELEKVCFSMGLTGMIASEPTHIDSFFDSLDEFQVLIIKTKPEAPAPRIQALPTTIATRFNAWLKNK